MSVSHAYRSTRRANRYHGVTRYSDISPVQRALTIFGRPPPRAGPRTPHLAVSVYAPRRSVLPVKKCTQYPLKSATQPAERGRKESIALLAGRPSRRSTLYTGLCTLVARLGRNGVLGLGPWSCMVYRHYHRFRAAATACRPDRSVARAEV